MTPEQKEFVELARSTENYIDELDEPLHGDDRSSGHKATAMGLIVIVLTGGNSVLLTAVVT